MKRILAYFAVWLIGAFVGTVVTVALVWLLLPRSVKPKVVAAPKPAEFASCEDAKRAWANLESDLMYRLEVPEHCDLNEIIAAATSQKR